MDKELRVEMRLRNNRLWKLIFPKWDSVAAFCRELSLHQVEVGDLLNLKKGVSPVHKKSGRYREICEKIASHFCMLPEDVFPLAIYTLEKTEGSAEIGPEQIPFHECALLPAADMIDPIIESVANKQLVEKILPLVTSRERMCLEMRFGLGGHKPCTLEEVGAAIGVIGSRAEQIIERAIRRIRETPKARRVARAYWERE